MEIAALVALRLGLSFAFLWTAYLIFNDKQHWSGALKGSWADTLLGVDNKTLMLTTASFDAFVGAWFLIGFAPWLAALFAAAHMIQVLLVTGLWGPSYRDVTIFSAAIAYFFLSAPQAVVTWLSGIG